MSVVKVGEVQFKKSTDTEWRKYVARIYVLVGDTVNFKAIPTPGSSWPAGKPAWGGEASGTGAEKNVTFSNAGEKTVGVWCDNATTLNITVISDVVVEFSKSEVRPGTGAARAETVVVTARRAAGGEAKQIDLSSSNTNVATVSPASFPLPLNEPSAQATVTVTGVAPSANNRDTSLLAKVGGVTKGALPITVTKPQNWESSGLTKPAPTDNTPGVAQSNNQWWVEWRIDAIYTVQDQWGETLHPQWQGALMLENDGGGWKGFTLPNGDPLNANAQVTDPWTYRLGPYATQQAAQDKLQDVQQNPYSGTSRTVVVDLRVVDGAAPPYDLDVSSKRVYTLVNNLLTVVESRVGP